MSNPLQSLLDSGRPLVMGVLNTTPDSFSDGGEFVDAAAAARRAEQMLEQGADIIDVGGESTRPGADDVAEADELARVIPVIQAIAAEHPNTVISIDTSKAAVMRAAVSAGASLINDVNALQAPGTLAAASNSGAHVCLMHMQGQPRTMQQAPTYGDVVSEVGDFLQNRVAACVDAGIERSRLLLDPGFGFGKTLQHNLTLMRGLPQLAGQLQLPLLIGVSRKSMLGALLDQPDPKKRLHGGVAAATAAVLWGARIVRTHDVAETRDALRVAAALTASGDTCPKPS